MATNTNAERIAREEILSKIRSAVGRNASSPVPQVPQTGRVEPRKPGDPEAELIFLLAEVEKLTGKTRRIGSHDEFKAALAELVEFEKVERATTWTTPEMRELGVPELLQELGVEMVSAGADKWEVAQCELGVTGVDGALPESGSLLVRSEPDKQRVVSLVPRVHLALMRREAMNVDLHDLFQKNKDASAFWLISGPSRTADIELTLTLGVHGPKTLYLWVLEY